MNSLFITGTDTDSGKTFVTAGITAEFRRQGVKAMPAKPVQTGCVNGTSPDLDFSVGTAGIHLSDIEALELCPLRYIPACSPHLAAELSNTEIEMDRLVRKLSALSAKYQTVIAEGAGGVLVPLGGGRTMLDLIKELSWPVLLVSRDRLGAINHTLLSIAALRTAGLEPAGVVINHTEPYSSLFSESNRRAIREYGCVEILGEIPFSPDHFPFASFTGICEKLMEILKL